MIYEKIEMTKYGETRFLHDRDNTGLFFYLNAGLSLLDHVLGYFSMVGLPSSWVSGWVNLTETIHPSPIHALTQQSIGGVSTTTKLLSYIECRLLHPHQERAVLNTAKRVHLTK